MGKMETRIREQFYIYLRALVESYDFIRLCRCRASPRALGYGHVHRAVPARTHTTSGHAVLGSGPKTMLRTGLLCPGLHVHA